MAVTLDGSLKKSKKYKMKMTVIILVNVNKLRKVKKRFASMQMYLDLRRFRTRLTFSLFTEIQIKIANDSPFRKSCDSTALL